MTYNIGTISLNFADNYDDNDEKDDDTEDEMGKQVTCFCEVWSAAHVNCHHNHIDHIYDHQHCNDHIYDRQHYNDFTCFCKVWSAAHVHEGGAARKHCMPSIYDDDEEDKDDSEVGGDDENDDGDVEVSLEEPDSCGHWCKRQFNNMTQIRQCLEFSLIRIESMLCW